MDLSPLHQALTTAEGYIDLQMYEAAWEELEALPTELKQDLKVLSQRIQILMGLGEYRKASYIGVTLIEMFPEKLGILLATAECLIQCQDYKEASQMLRNGLSRLSDQPDLWLTLARVESLLGDLDSAKECVKKYVTLNPEGKAAVLDIPEFAALW